MKHSHKVPRPELVVSFIVMASPDRLSGRPNLDAHISGLAQERAFLCNIIVRPSEQLDNCTLLTVVEVALCSAEIRLIPDEVQGLKNEFFATGTGDGNSESATKGRRDLIDIARLARTTIEGVCQAFTSPRSCVYNDHGRGSRRGVLNVRIPNKVTVILEGRDICGITLRRRLPSPAFRGRCEIVVPRRARILSVPVPAAVDGACRILERNVAWDDGRRLRGRDGAPRTSNTGRSSGSGTRRSCCCLRGIRSLSVGRSRRGDLVIHKVPRVIVTAAS